MKRLLLFLLAAVFFVSACNNNKDNGKPNTNNREKDNYFNNNGRNERENNNDEGGWTSEEKQKALRDCVDAMENKVDENTARNYCSCVLEKTMQKYSSYEKADAMATEAEGESWGRQCQGELTNNRDNNNDRNNDRNYGVQWSGNDETRFMNDCESSARQNVSAQRATQYCDCMLQKVKKLFSSYAEADKGLLQMSKDELNSMVEDCNGDQ